MTIWKPASEKPPEGAIVAVLDQHWKKQGWLSVELHFGTAHHHWEEDRWWVENNDDRGYGTEMFIPEGEDTSFDTFSHWAYVVDLPALPEEMAKR